VIDEKGSKPNSRKVSYQTGGQGSGPNSPWRKQSKGSGNSYKKKQSENK